MDCRSTHWGKSALWKVSTKKNRLSIKFQSGLMDQLKCKSVRKTLMVCKSSYIEYKLFKWMLSEEDANITQWFSRITKCFLFFDKHIYRKALSSKGPCVSHILHLYSEELQAEEALRLRAFLLWRARLWLANSPPSQAEQQCGEASTPTFSLQSISKTSCRETKRGDTKIIHEAGVKHDQASS